MEYRRNMIYGWWQQVGSNHRPRGYDSLALPLSYTASTVLNHRNILLTNFTNVKGALQKYLALGEKGWLLGQDLNL